MSKRTVNRRYLTQTLISAAILALLIGGCAAPTPEVVQETITEVVKETVVVEGTPQVVEVEKVVTATPEAPGEQKPAGQIIVAQAADPAALDPKFMKGREMQNALRLIFDSLYHRDDNMQIVPWLATSYENPDPLTWRFHLREDVKFHNGNDFRANDVKFTIERMLEDDSLWSARNFIDKVEVVDDYTVDIITQEPYAALMTRVVLWQMTDEEYFDEVGADGFANQPVGTGPFGFVEWIRDERLVFEANTDYWRGAPRIETVLFRSIPEPATRIAALEAGDVDIVSAVPPDYVDLAPQSVEVLTVPGTRAFFIGMNVTMEPFDDVRVRQALNYAVDMDSIIDNLMNGLARKIDNPLLPEAFGYADTPIYYYDPTRAQALLADAGYPDGFEMQLDTYPDLKELGEALAGQLSEVGVEVDVNVMERAALYAKYEPGFSQAYLSSWGNSEADADGMLSKQFYSKRYGCNTLLPPDDPESGYGNESLGCFYTGYGNADVDAAVEAGAMEVDPDKRKAHYYTALTTIVSEPPWVFLHNPEEIYAQRDRVQNWVPRSDALIILDKASVTQ